VLRNMASPLFSALPPTRADRQQRALATRLLTHGPLPIKLLLTAVAQAAATLAAPAPGDGAGAATAATVTAGGTSPCSDGAAGGGGEDDEAAVARIADDMAPALRAYFDQYGSENEACPAAVVHEAPTRKAA